ncbi:hypothetical protein CPC08DRAFT_503229 [Agrocybe pediades]|nr:hypothetical protein CPC08DRAFT_503229 [Agrocybe pediades]
MCSSAFLENGVFDVNGRCYSAPGLAWCALMAGFDLCIAVLLCWMRKVGLQLFMGEHILRMKACSMSAKSSNAQNTFLKY